MVPPLCVAVDAEFLKMGGALLSRSIALVPFSTPVPQQPPTMHRGAVVHLSTSFVANHCDILPAGYALVDHCRLFSDGLQRFFTPPTPARDNRRSAQLLATRHLPSPDDDPLASGSAKRRGVEAAVSAPSDLPPPVAPPHFHIDPFFVPNTLQFHDHLLGALHSEDPGSPRFRRAASLLVTKSFAFGTGKLSTPSMAALVRRDSPRFQQFLRFRFPTELDWLRWLDASRALSHDALEQVAGRLRVHSASGRLGDGAPPFTEVGGATMEATPQYEFHEHDTLLSYARCLREVWSKYMTADGGNSPTKFYAYGSADLGVVRDSVRLACHEVGRSASTDGGRDAPTLITSPMQVAITDITASSAFRAMGFEVEKGLTPRLRDALAKVQGRSLWSASLLRAPDEHNPLWDAAALAAVCQVVLRPPS